VAGDLHLGVLSRSPAAFYFARRALIIYADHGTQQIASSRQLLARSASTVDLFFQSKNEAAMLSA
jgi:hypothetical protein